MNRMAWTLLFSAVLCGCLARGHESKDAVELQREPIENIAECLTEWDAVMDWMPKIAGVRDGHLRALRESLQLDTESRFAAFAREAWRAQEKPATGSLGDPLTSASMRVVEGQIEPVVKKFVSEGCAVTIWVDDMLWRAALAHPETAQWLKREVASHGMEFDSPQARKWFKYWLLVKLE